MPYDKWTIAPYRYDTSFGRVVGLHHFAGWKIVHGNFRAFTIVLVKQKGIASYTGPCPKDKSDLRITCPLYYVFNKTGAMNSDLFLEIIKHFTKPFNDNHPKLNFLLLLDNPVAHSGADASSWAKAHNLDMLFFPPHTSHFLQPLDQTFFSRFKQ